VLLAVLAAQALAEERDFAAALVDWLCSQDRLDAPPAPGPLMTLAAPSEPRR
jgi:hypothetical protein